MGALHAALELLGCRTATGSRASPISLAHTQRRPHTLTPTVARRYEEATAAYARMHDLEDQATVLAREVGCVMCVLGDPACNPAHQVGKAEAAAYLTNMPVPPWPAPPRHGAPDSLPHTSHLLPAAGALPEPDGGGGGDGGPGGGAANMYEARAVGAVVGGLVADAAAAGVHWVYDLDLLAQLGEVAAAKAAQQQQQQPCPTCTHGPEGTISSSTKPVSTAQHSPGAHAPPTLADTCGTGAGAEGGWERARVLAAAVAADLGHPPPLEFMDPPRSPFYTYACGRNSP